MAGFSPLLALLVLAALLAVVLVPVSATAGDGGSDTSTIPNPPTIAWGTAQQIIVAQRGIACTSPKLYLSSSGKYNYQSNSIYYTGGATATNWTNWQSLPSVQPPPWTWKSYPYPNGYWSPREGHYLHWSDNNYYASGTAAMIIGGGKDGTSTAPPSTGQPAVIMSYDNGTWIPASSSQSPPPAPMGNSWNWTTTPWLEPLQNGEVGADVVPRYLLILYGGWIPDSSPATGHFDNNFYIAEAAHTVQAADAITNGITSPWPAARNGPGLGGFNASYGDPGAGMLIALGGWDITNFKIYNDIWIASTARPGGSWRMVTTNAPWTPRWGQKVIDGGRLGLFVYGGYVTPGLWQRNDVWYGQWPATNTYSSDPQWMLVPATGGAGIYEPACHVAYWETDARLWLVTMATKTDDPFNLDDSGVTPPSIRAYTGLITYTSS